MHPIPIGFKLAHKYVTSSIEINVRAFKSIQKTNPLLYYAHQISEIGCMYTKWIHKWRKHIKFKFEITIRTYINVGIAISKCRL